MSTSRRIACLRVPPNPTGERGDADAAVLAGALLTAAPRVTPVQGHPLAFWADATGMERRGGDAAVAQALLAAARNAGADTARVGIAGSCIAAAAATRERGSAWRVVPPGRDHAFLARRPLAVLPLEDDLRRTLSLLGLSTCGELGRLSAAEVELRFGSAGLTAWRLARAEDDRWPFRPPTPDHPSAEVGLEAPVASVEPLRFLLRGLVAAIVAQAAERQRLPAALRLTLRLEGAPDEAHDLRPARATGDERVLLELCTAVLERSRLPAPVAGVRLEGIEQGTARADQLDAFQAAAPDPVAVHSALAPLLSHWGEGALSRALPRGAHLPSEHARWDALGAAGIEELSRRRPKEEVPHRHAGAELPLCLRRLSAPREIRVGVDGEGRVVEIWTAPARGAASPQAIRTAVRAAGPERISGAWWGDRYAREYWLAEAMDGRLWLLFREGRQGGWYLEGWYD